MIVGALLNVEHGLCDPVAALVRFDASGLKPAKRATSLLGGVTDAS